MKHLAIDIGAESGRCVIGEPRDGGMTMTEVHRFANGGVRAGAHLRWDALGLWREIKTGMRAAAQHGRIDTIGICTWGVDYGLLDVHDELLGNPFTYRDHRTDGVMQRALRDIGREKIFEETGIQFMSINTLYQLMAEREQNARVLGLARRLLMMPDLFHFWLTGEKINEYTNASTTQLLNMRTGQWSAPLLAAIDVSPDLLHPPTHPGTRLGKLRKDVADDTGLHDAEVIVVGTHDTASAVAAVVLSEQNATGDGRRKTGEMQSVPRHRSSVSNKTSTAYISSGTWSLVGVATPKAIVNAQTMGFNMTNEGGCIGDIRLLKNVMGLWMIQQCRAEWAAQGETHSYAALAQLAEASACRSVIDAADERLLNPQSMIATVQAMCAEASQPIPKTTGDIARTVFNSLAHTCARVLGELETVTSSGIETVTVVGGGAKNTLLNNLIAQASGKRVVAGETEATALGNLLVQARAAGA